MGRTTFKEAMKVTCPLCGAGPGQSCVSIRGTIKPIEGPIPKGTPCGIHNNRLRAVPVMDREPYRLNAGWFCMIEGTEYGPWKNKGAARAGYETELRRNKGEYHGS